MQLNDIKVNKKKSSKRVGRGGKRGTYSGRGQKGQKSRSGSNKEPLIRSIIKRYPKLRGYRFKAIKNIAIVNVCLLEKNFKHKELIDPRTLVKKKLVRRIKGRVPAVKILGNGETSKSFIVEHCALSKLAMEKIEKAGGKITI